MFRRRSGIPSNIRGIERFVWGLYSAPITASSFRFWGSATSGRLGRVTVLPQLKVDRLCSVVDGTAEFDPKPTVGRFTDDRLRIRLSGSERLSHARKRCSRTCVHAETEILSLQSIPPDRGPPSTVRVAFERAALRPSGLERRMSNSMADLRSSVPAAIAHAVNTVRARNQ